VSETSTAYYQEGVAPRAIATSQLMGQVLFLVAIALAFCAAGTLIGKDLAFGTARAFSFAGFGMLLVSSFAGERFRVGPFAMFWLFATALAIGIGLGPVIAYFASVETDALTQAFAGTAATVAGAAALGFFLSKDLARWMRPLSLVVFAACAGTVVVAVRRRDQPVGQPRDLRAVGRADRGRLQLPAQARDRARHDLARDRHLRLDRQHLHLAAEHLLLGLRARVGSVGGVSTHPR
jgi:hypothetical protein